MMVEDEQILYRFMPFSGSSPIVRLRPGDVFFDPAPHRLATLLGSCAAVCLWDERKRMGGMTHSIIPNQSRVSQHPGADLTATDSSIRELVARMRAAGCRTATMSAKLFGGFTPMKTLSSGIGAANIATAIRVIEEYNIRIIARETLDGGGMVIYQDTGTGEVCGRRINALEPRPRR